ncbi:TVP38/TMEM64 family protein [Nostoc sp. FACHB-152]|uniref:TVP38/TMEM64 family protein n=1 Tax=unclassified Nostoc TaxID=2593658 RepID=UPI0016825E66|nr:MULTISPECIES: TVP38/TMEM64 family protein [unclassified Nostoc]MBD2446244.1 TVP38/TMEM64 family protein [Nostoc sp. FACHB-152]MBD2469514.1 TVP38/TMEM64 family protein [Nostoc sp. FACHB-145]
MIFTKNKLRFKGKFKFCLLIFLIAVLIIAAKFLNIQEFLHSLINQVNSLGIWGPVAYIGIYNLATLLFVPGSLLTLKGGCLFGLFWGSVYVLIAALIGATLAFLVGRYLSRDWVASQIDKHPKLQAIDLAVAQEGWKIVLLTRLCPIFPFNLLNYVFGVTQVSLKDYILGSFGIIPGTVMYVYIGSLAGNLVMSNVPMTPEAQIYEQSMQVIGLIATVAVTIYITKVAQKALHQSMVITEAKKLESRD